MTISKTELEGHIQMSAEGLPFATALRQQQTRELCLPESGDDADRIQDSQDVRQPGFSLSVLGAKVCIFCWLPIACSREIKFKSLRLWRSTNRAHSVETGSRKEHCSP